ncbi:MAG TPA: hypothetical protein VFC51_08215 [Chloroflexota bacterium]|nr:hypothetical protein [Chloroflexota bacterium]
MQEIPVDAVVNQSDGGRPGPDVESEVVVLEGMLKEGHVRGFTVMSDEAERTGGTNTAPSPLAYFTLAIGF